MKSRKQKRKAYRRKESSLQTALSDTIGMGIGSVAGMSAMGAINAQVPGGAGAPLMKTTGASLNLLNTGQMLKNTKAIMKSFK